MSLPKTARAAVVAEYGKPIEIRELPVPREAELEPGALLVRVDVASICGSDVHQWDGMTQALAPASLPIVLGHEMMGTVVAFGPGPREDSIGQPLQEGDRLLWTHVYCGQCYECRVQHTPTLCRRKKQYMRTNCERFPYLVGGFAQYCYVFPPSGRVRIPDGVSDGVASAASCALRTVVHAFDRLGRLEPHQQVVIQGAGPLGLFATAMASDAGARELIVVGAPERRLALARRWGATATVSVEELPSAEARLARVRELTGGLGADVVCEMSGAPYAFAEGLDFLRPGGRYTVVGQLGGPLTPVQAALFVRKQATILGVQSADIGQFWKALEFVRRAGSRYDFEAMLTTRYPLDRINEAIQNMRAFREIKPLVLPWAER
jgi:threonine dehydrogenase-like Zn-dependent dehydrogenase